MKVQELRKALRKLFNGKSITGFNVEFSDEQLIKNGVGFFPYGKGLLTTADETPNDCVLFLGSDFGTEQYIFDKITKGQDESSNPTYRNLTELLIGKENAHRAFLSNVFMGLRKEGSNISNYTTFTNDPEYQELSKQFFLFQIEVIKPRKIVALGEKVAKFIEANYQFEVEVLPIIHPSLLHSNVSQKLKRNKGGADVTKEETAQEIEQIKKRIWQ